MIRKTTPLPWHTINTALLLLVLAVVLLLRFWPQHRPPYWFVSYQWTKGKEHGAGRTCLKSAGNSPDIAQFESAIATKNSFDSVIVITFRDIDQTTFEGCVKKP